MEVVGVDAFSKGWVAVRLEDGAFGGAATLEDFQSLVEAFPPRCVIAVDIPIGLPQGTEPRAADAAARAFLQGGASTVFSVPPRRVLEAATYSEARRLAVEMCGRSLSAQSFALGKKILDVDGAPTDGRLFEVHPEVSFRALKGAALSDRKKTWNGAMERRALLASAGIELPDVIEEVQGVGLDDVLDAAAAAWSAQRIAEGRALSLPATAERIGDREVAIWY